MEKSRISVDRIAIGLSGACAIHCLLSPLAVILLPALGATALAGETFHRLLLVAVLPSSLIALTMGCRKHRDRYVLLLGTVGLSILVFAAFHGHDILGEGGETGATLAGAAIIAASHVRNHRLCGIQRMPCDCSAEHQEIRPGEK